ncbi:MAG: EamA family transporter [Oscillospiraceae bacterium]|nr:EamA family transporter [Oscillospiraceae bacterium]
MKTDRRSLPYGVYLLSMLIFGTNGLLVAHISVQSSQIVLLRTLIGGALLTAVVLLRGGFDRTAIRPELPMLLLGGIALGLNWVALFGAYRLLNVSLATLIYYIGPILVLLFSPLLFRETLTPARIAAAVLVAVGLVCISGSVLAAGRNAAGLAAAVASALFYAALIVFNKRITRTEGLQTAAIELDVAFAVVLVYCLATAGLPRPLPSDLPWLALIGAVNTGLAYLLYFSGLQKLSGQSAAIMSYADPVSALLFSAFFLHESLSPVQIVGAVLIIGGAMLGESRRRKAR